MQFKSLGSVHVGTSLGVLHKLSMCHEKATFQPVCQMGIQGSGCF